MSLNTPPIHALQLSIDCVSKEIWNLFQSSTSPVILLTGIDMKVY